MEQRVFSVTQVNNYIKGVMDSDPLLGGLLVRGELSNYKIYPSGHHYFTLKDAEGSLRCVMYQGKARSLRFRPADGMQVIASGNITVFPRDGTYKLYCDSLSVSGVGDLHMAYEQLKEKLYREGLFDQAHKKPLPRYPQRIAVITSGAGAVLHDIIRVVRARYPLVKILLLPVRVQGPEAPPEIVAALRYANRWKLGDVIITGRGGGSIEDLWAFNDEGVARAIYDSEIPVISAVGHEPDVTIADFVADVRAATPSNAGEIAVPDMAELQEQLRSTESAMAGSLRRHLTLLRQNLDTAARKRVLRDPMAFLQDKRMLLGYMQKEMSHAGESLLAAPRRKLGALAASIDALSPLKVLGRGYAMVTDRTGQVVRSVRDIQIDDDLSIILGDGTARCRVEETVYQEAEHGKSEKEL